MPRIILFSGKGGVGKTTIAAATGLAASIRGSRTLLLSFDLAHSLSDSFDLDKALFDQNEGRPRKINEHLDIQEIDVALELERQWREVHQYLVGIFSASGLRDVVAEEAAILPGMEDVVALMTLNSYIKENRYDTYIVDCPPTSESLRFANITATLEWYVGKRFNLDRRVLKMARPILGKKAAAYGVPEDNYFEGLQRMFKGLEGVNDLLVDPATTSVRLVCNAEKMVIRETKRAFMYFNLYGISTEQIVINKVFPSTRGYFSEWSKQQKAYCQEVRDFFEPVPVVSVPFFKQEVVGIEALSQIGEELFNDEHLPTSHYIKEPPFKFLKEGSKYIISLKLPFVDKSEINLMRVEQSLIVRIGSFKRHIPLPTAIANCKVLRASKEVDQLRIVFQKRELEPAPS